jgi:hypothetical protein
MSRHPGRPTDDEQDAAAEEFYAPVLYDDKLTRDVINALDDFLVPNPPDRPPTEWMRSAVGFPSVAPATAKTGHFVEFSA